MTSVDRVALAAVFRATGGASWTRKANWDTELELSKWFGVEVVEIDGVRRVVGLDLHDNNLRGISASSTNTSSLVST